MPLNQPAEVISLTYRGRRLQRYRTEDGEREMRLTLDEQEEESLSQLRNLPLGRGVTLEAMGTAQTLKHERGVYGSREKAQAARWTLTGRSTTDVFAAAGRSLVSQPVLCGVSSA